MERQATEVRMKVDILIEDESGRRMVEVDGTETRTRNLVLTPWVFGKEKFSKLNYAVTHVPSGRCISRGPMSYVDAMKYSDEISDKINWSLPIHDFGPHLEAKL
jgi:hypothetical protein